jgi:hypothetical protein
MDKSAATRIKICLSNQLSKGLNLAYEQSDYLSRIVEQAGVARSMLSNTNLVSFEIGNEPGNLGQLHTLLGQY